MKVKVGNTIYDGDKEPVMIILDPVDKVNIHNMLPEATKYVCFPNTMSDEEAREWMHEEVTER